MGTDFDSYTEVGRAEIRRAAEAIQILLDDAVSDRCFDDVAELANLAKRLSEIVPLESAADSRDGDVEELQEQLRKRYEGGTSGSSGSLQNVVAGSSRPNGSRWRGRKAEYPRFRRDGATLVKIGWSKSSKSEYQHKAPKMTVDVLATKLHKVSKPNGDFAMSSVLPLKAGKEEIPEYQVYLSLGWLRAIGAVQQRGRQGYSICAEDLLAAIKQEWEAMTNGGGGIEE